MRLEGVLYNHGEVSRSWWQASISTRSAVAIIGVAAALSMTVGALRLSRRSPEPTEARADTRGAVHVPLFVGPELVRHRSRLSWSFDPPGVLAEFRAAEHLDNVVKGAERPEEMMRALMKWTRAQWNPGRPDPYPPPDARVVLSEIRAGRTGGFCAQYSFVLVQAIQSFGLPARCATIKDHEIIEGWLPDEERWTAFDPTCDLQVTEESGRSLSALEIREAVAAGRRLRLTRTDLLTESPELYLKHYSELAIWIRNDFVSNPMNFKDFSRYRVWYDPGEAGGLSAAPPGALRTSLAADLYP